MISGAACADHHMEGMPERELRTKPCPTCGKPAADPFRPFCSRRCADVDLNRWLSGVYAVPLKEEEDEDGTPSAKPSEEAS
jgi:endogenous inhibitor of DNA gyrase (YacG/DUF329 family)